MTHVVTSWRRKRMLGTEFVPPLSANLTPVIDGNDEGDSE